MDTEEKDNLKEYEAAVKNYAANKINCELRNNGPEHASIILNNIFSNANKCIRIAADKLSDNEVVDTIEYVNSMKSFLDKEGTELYILLTNYNEEDIKSKIGTCFLKELARHNAYSSKDKRVFIKCGNGSSFTINDDNNKRVKVNFTTADSIMYRFEYDTEKKSAICNFGDKFLTKEYEEAFKGAFEKEENTEIKLENLINA